MMTIHNLSLIKISILVCFAFTLCSCKKISTKTQSIAFHEYAAFDWFSYEGKDEFYNSTVKTDDEYLNPILSGFYPDPSICRVGNKFYLINSSFTYFPGLPLFESTDLIHWKQIGHVINRKEQADFTGANVSDGMYAPTIRYYKGTFYVICTNVSGIGNFIVTAKNPRGPWSTPVKIPFDGIDPDIFFDDNDKVYITHNGPPPNNKSLHDGHRAIYMFEFDIKKFKIVSESKCIINGGTDMTQKPVWIEGPHIFKKSGYYYLICAQGGTGFQHSEVVFRSQNIFGPYISYANNPILGQSHLDPNRKNEISTTGHADFVELKNGDWWTVFLGCRPYEKDFYNTGRETFMLPVQWKDGWPEIVGGNSPIPLINKRPNLPITKEIVTPTSGNFINRDDFNAKKLGMEWNFLRTPNEKWYQLSKGQLYMMPRKESVHTKTNFSFIGRRQQNTQFEVSTKLTYSPSSITHTAGLLAFQNEKHYFLLGKRSNIDGNIEVFLERTATTLNNGESTIIAKNELNVSSNDIYLKIEGIKRYYNFYYKTSEKENWTLLASGIDGSILSTKEASGFVGSYLAMYASSQHFKP